eukprot:CAMPEP_0183445714 /NCGR_PEP_ID=MMETSP0370-20130417/96488_1 /TAXON_ID=268820 /ORGANISM="Peridinium aciculiferum, Strain PAER-2" /LENGTH=63 /DNA_ID=CAMNT_0025636337 /DNA_START=277 /DNA_END=464 /DNA_ORIENTATION=+
MGPPPHFQASACRFCLQPPVVAAVACVDTSVQPKLLMQGIAFEMRGPLVAVSPPLGHPETTGV